MVGEMPEQPEIGTAGSATGTPHREKIHLCDFLVLVFSWIYIDMRAGRARPRTKSHLGDYPKLKNCGLSSYISI